MGEGVERGAEDLTCAECERMKGREGRERRERQVENVRLGTNENAGKEKGG